MAVQSPWNALQQHLTLTFVTIAAFKIKLNGYHFQELLVQHCGATNVGTALRICNDFDYEYCKYRLFFKLDASLAIFSLFID